MSLATVTVTVLPLFVAQASAAALTALVSASPEEAMSIVRSTGPLADAGERMSRPSSSNPPPPQALRSQCSARGSGPGWRMRAVRVIE